MEEPHANGLAEAAVRQGKAKARVLVQRLREGLGADVANDHPAMPWLVMHATMTVNVARVRQNGMTPFRARHGQDFEKPKASFGETVLYFMPGKHLSRWVVRSQPGIFFGLEARRQGCEGCGEDHQAAAWTAV